MLYPNLHVFLGAVEATKEEQDTIKEALHNQFLQLWRNGGFQHPEEYSRDLYTRLHALVAKVDPTFDFHDHPPGTDPKWVCYDFSIKQYNEQSQDKTQGPYWVHPHEDGEGGFYVRAYLLPTVSVSQLKALWPSGYNATMTLKERIVYTEAFPKPTWWQGE